MDNEERRIVIKRNSSSVRDTDLDFNFSGILEGIAGTAMAKIGTALGDIVTNSILKTMGADKEETKKDDDSIIRGKQRVIYDTHTPVYDTEKDETPSSVKKVFETKAPVTNRAHFFTVIAEGMEKVKGNRIFDLFAEGGSSDPNVVLRQAASLLYVYSRGDIDFDVSYQTFCKMRDAFIKIMAQSQRRQDTDEDEVEADMDSVTMELGEKGIKNGSST